jgi:hypothetical protein
MTCRPIGVIATLTLSPLVVSLAADGPWPGRSQWSASCTP